MENNLANLSEDALKIISETERRLAASGSEKVVLVAYKAED